MKISITKKSFLELNGCVELSDIVESKRYTPKVLNEIQDALELIYKDHEMQSFDESLQRIIELDDSYVLSPMELLEYRMVGDLYMRALQAVGELKDDDLMDALGKNASPMSRAIDLSNRLEKLRVIGKQRAEEKMENKNDFWDADELEMEGRRGDTTFKVSKKKNDPPIDIDDLEDYEG
jgi:hypothetical protein